MRADSAVHKPQRYIHSVETKGDVRRGDLFSLTLLVPLHHRSIRKIFKKIFYKTLNQPDKTIFILQCKKTQKGYPD